MIPTTRSPGAAAIFSQRVSSSFMEDWDGDYTTHAAWCRLDALSSAQGVIIGAER
jgi:hypothetical protein